MNFSYFLREPGISVRHLDSIILPVHAQASGLSLTAQVELDNGEVDGSFTFSAGVNAVNSVDDGMDFLISGVLNPPVAQAVSVDVDVTGGDLDTGASLPLAPVVANGATGAFTFPLIGTDDIPDNTAETLTTTVSTSGVPDSVIVVNFTSV